jgi:hypothetical protein
VGSSGDQLIAHRTDYYPTRYTDRERYPNAASRRSNFLLLGAFFGILFLLVTPPLQSPDEQEHFFRSYQVSEGQWTAQRRTSVTFTFGRNQNLE